MWANPLTTGLGSRIGPGGEIDAPKASFTSPEEFEAESREILQMGRLTDTDHKGSRVRRR